MNLIFMYTFCVHTFKITPQTFLSNKSFAGPKFQLDWIPSKLHTDNYFLIALCTKCVFEHALADQPEKLKVKIYKAKYVLLLAIMWIERKFIKLFIGAT